MTPFLKRIASICLIVTAIMAATHKELRAQEEDESYWESLLQTEVEVENPVYKPVISFSSGILHFMGDVRTTNNPLVGNWGHRLTVSTFIGKDNHYRLNFFIMNGSLTGHSHELSLGMRDYRHQDPENNQLRIPNSAFQTDIWEFGLSLEYSFGHFLGMAKTFRPFVSLGFSPLLFNPSGNIYNNQTGGFYHFWNDGTIRDASQTGPGAWRASRISFDDEWETNLSGSEFHDLERYDESSFVIPLEVGFDFYISYRINLRVASGLHYSFTDLLDNFNTQAAEHYNIQNLDFHNGRNDMFLFTNISLNFDLFSDPTYYIIEREFAEIEYFDYEVMFGDQDGDGVFDRLDMCPDTPIGVAVDSLGCPFDSDGDGVPDHIDLEPNTPSGAIIDDRGRQISPEQLEQMFNITDEVVNRQEARTIPVPPAWSRRVTVVPGEVPEKLQHVDLDGDGYISFSELMLAVERFFNQESDLTLEDMYELNNYFFSQ